MEPSIFNKKGDSYRYVKQARVCYIAFVLMILTSVSFLPEKEGDIEHLPAFQYDPCAAVRPVLYFSALGASSWCYSESVGVNL